MQYKTELDKLKDLYEKSEYSKFQTQGSNLGNIVQDLDRLQNGRLGTNQYTVQELMAKEIYFLRYYKEERLSKDIVNTRDGVYYLDRAIIPDNIWASGQLEKAQITYTNPGLYPAKYLDGYLSVDNPNADTAQINGVELIKCKDEKELIDLNRELINNNIDCDIDYNTNTIRVYSNQMKAKALINKFREDREKSFITKTDESYYSAIINDSRDDIV